MHEFEEREKADLEPQVDLPTKDYLRNESANIEKLFWGPTTVKIDDQGRIYVVDTAGPEFKFTHGKPRQGTASPKFSERLAVRPCAVPTMDLS